MAMLVHIQIEKELFPILQLPGRPKALLDKTVADIYHVETKHINQAFNRNRKRFPDDFYYELTTKEFETIAENHSPTSKYSYNVAKAYTLAGINMLATILRSDIAIRRSVEIIRAFTMMETDILPSRDKKWDTITAKIITAINRNVENLKENVKSFQEDVAGLHNTIQILNNRVQHIENKITDLENPKQLSAQQNRDKLLLSSTPNVTQKQCTLSNPLKLTFRQEKALKYIESNGKITNKDYRELWQVSQSTAIRELKQMVEVSILEKQGSGKNTFYKRNRL